MSAVGGSIESLILDGRIFSVTADSEATRKPGGWEIEVQANGDGTARIIKTRVPLSLDGIVIQCDDSRGDQEFIEELKNRHDFFPIGIVYPSGITYQGQAQITGENGHSSQSATIPISLMGPGKLTKQG
jgi:hypothetical protein